MSIYAKGAKPNKKAPPIFIVGIVLLCAFLFSVNLTGGLYARYTTRAQGGDSARVAVFKVTETLDPSVMIFPVNQLAPGDSISQKITVINDSEVAIRYTVVLENLTQNLNLTLTGYEGTVDIRGSAEFTVSVAWEKANGSPSDAGKTDTISITLLAEQID